MQGGRGGGSVHNNTSESYAGGPAARESVVINRFSDGGAFETSGIYVNRAVKPGTSITVRRVINRAEGASLLFTTPFVVECVPFGFVGEKGFFFCFVFIFYTASTCTRLNVRYNALIASAAV